MLLTLTHYKHNIATLSPNMLIKRVLTQKNHRKYNQDREDNYKIISVDIVLMQFVCPCKVLNVHFLCQNNGQLGRLLVYAYSYKPLRYIYTLY